MLKLLLGHWQSHREPLPFVLTDDPLYCSHLTTSPFPEVYSVNRINPIFEEEESSNPTPRTQPPTSPRNDAYRTFPANRKTVKIQNGGVISSPNFVLRKANSNALEYSSHLEDGFAGRRSPLKRSSSEEETKSSDDTGYSSTFKSLTTLEDSDGSADDHRPMSSDSDDCSSHPPQEATVVVSVDVHRVSTPDDVLVRTPSSDHYSYRSYGSSPEPFDSLTMSSSSSEQQQVGNRKVKEKLQRLLEKGNQKKPDSEVVIQKTRSDLMKSLTRALNSKAAPKGVVTRSDDSTSPKSDTRPPSASSSTTPKAVVDSTGGVTRQDESNSSSLSSFAKTSLEKESKEPSRKGGHRCKVCENAKRPLAFHQLLPGHWSYDNVYLPQIHGMMCPCMHHFHPSSSEDDVFFPPHHHPSRRSWALDKGRSRDGSSKDARYSPDGETDSSRTSSKRLKTFSERRSLRETKRCEGDRCHLSRDCPCHCLSHNRKVKFASDSDLSQHKHLHKNGMANGDPMRAALVMSMPHLNGHLPGKGPPKEAGKLKKPPPLPPFVPRGLKEPIKMEELYGAYPINFRDWESHYRRNFLQKRKKRALTMVGMAIGIVMVVGIAVALTFVFLRIRRPAS